MEKVSTSTENIAELEAFLRTYEVKESDLSSLAEKIDTLVQSTLLDESTLSGLKIATFDSGNLYIFSREPHESTPHFPVTDLGQQTPSGFHCYKISSTYLGKDIEQYRGAGAWLELPEIENTAKEPILVSNPKILNQEGKNHISKVILLSPEGAFNKAGDGNYDYFADLLAHEMGHIEEMSHRDWPNDGIIDAFPEAQSQQKFTTLIQEAAMIPAWLRDELVSHIDRSTLGEMYAMLIDGEAKKIFRSEIYGQHEGAFITKVNEIKKEELQPLLNWAHERGYILARILEIQIPDYHERKKFVQEIFGGHEDGV